MMPDTQLKQAPDSTPSDLVVAVLSPQSGLDDLISILRVEHVQCLNITQYDPGMDYAELLEYGLTGDSYSIGILFVNSRTDYDVVYKAGELQRTASRFMVGG